MPLLHYTAAGLRKERGKGICYHELNKARLTTTSKASIYVWSLELVWLRAVRGNAVSDPYERGHSYARISRRAQSLGHS